jgi:hypothetical protein
MQFGAEQFNKDLRVVTSYFASNMKKGMKEKFSRLTQIAYLLNLEKVLKKREVDFQLSALTTGHDLLYLLFLFSQQKFWKCGERRVDK